MAKEKGKSKKKDAKKKGKNGLLQVIGDLFKNVSKVMGKGGDKSKVKIAKAIFEKMPTVIASIQKMNADDIGFLSLGVKSFAVAAAKTESRGDAIPKEFEFNNAVQGYLALRAGLLGDKNLKKMVENNIL